MSVNSTEPAGVVHELVPRNAREMHPVHSSTCAALLISGYLRADARIWAIVRCLLYEGGAILVSRNGRNEGVSAVGAVTVTYGTDTIVATIAVGTRSERARESRTPEPAPPLAPRSDANPTVGDTVGERGRKLWFDRPSKRAAAWTGFFFI